MALKMINFDEEIAKDHKHHYLFPDCHYMLVGGTGCGKTNLICNMLLQSWLKTDKIILYTINADQDKYELLDGFFNSIEDSEDVFVIKSPEDICPVEDLDCDTDKVIIFDDIKLDKKNMDRIKEYFSLSRHKKANCIYLCQSYFDVPKYIRRNTKCFVLFEGLDHRDIQTIASDHSTIPKADFCSIYKSIDVPHGFMTVDKTAKYPPEMYRSGFDKFYDA